MNQKTLFSSPGLSKGPLGRLSKTSPETTTVGEARPRHGQHRKKDENLHLAWETQLADIPGRGRGEGCFQGKDSLGDRILTGGRQRENKGVGQKSRAFRIKERKAGPRSKVPDCESPMLQNCIQSSRVGSS